MPEPNRQHPDFLVIGAMKCGTTTLYHDLRSQPALFLPDKETNLLLTDDPPRAFDHAFRKAGPGALRGEVCPDYTKPKLDRAAASHATSPLKLIYVVRHPIDRTISHHHFLSTQRGDVKPGGMTTDFEASLRDFPELIETSLYSERVQPWIDRFGRENLLILRFEDYVSRRSETVNRICDFLGADFQADGIREDRVFNPSEARPVATPAWRKILRNPLYRRYVRPFLPLQLRDKIRAAIFPKAAPAAAPPKPETLHELARKFQPDVEKLSALCGKSEPLWDLDTTGEDGS